MVLNYIKYAKYSILFFKLWSINKLLFGIPFYLIEHLVLSNTIKLTYQGGKYILVGIGNYLFPTPIVVKNVPENTNIEENI